jgi:hypothetical protein
MHGPDLLNQILSLKFRIDTTPSEQCEELFRKVEELTQQLQLISKLPEERVKKVILKQYIVYANEQSKSLGDGPQQLVLEKREDVPTSQIPTPGPV